MKNDRLKPLSAESSTNYALNRRNLLGFIGGTLAVSLVGCLRSQSTVGESAAAESTAQAPIEPITPSCVVKPQQTEGPYFVDERLDRSDIRSDPTDGSIRQGVPIRIAFQISQIAESACMPLSGAIVDIWHCDAQGVYSDVNDRNFNTVGKKFLRGYQVTDDRGIAEFATIYPGGYQGRAVHIHFKIRIESDIQPYEFTSQLYFDDSLTEQIHIQSAYAGKGDRALKNAQDSIFREGGEQLLLPLTAATNGYTGNFGIGLQIV